MSTDGTNPPSIAPKRPAGQTGTVPVSPGTDLPRPRPVSTPVSGPTAPSGASVGTAPSNAAPSTTGSTPSVTERLRNAASTVTGAVRTPAPPRGEERPAPARTPRPAPARTATATSAAASTGPRRVRLALARIDPWSVMKLSFLLSVAIGIMIVVASAVVWYTLDGLHVFSQLNDTIAEVTGSTTFFDLNEYASFERTISLATMIAVVDVILLTALSTIGAFLYNIVAALVGGLHLTLTDD